MCGGFSYKNYCGMHSSVWWNLVRKLLLRVLHIYTWKCWGSLGVVDYYSKFCIYLENALVVGVTISNRLILLGLPPWQMKFLNNLPPTWHWVQFHLVGSIKIGGLQLNSASGIGCNQPSHQNWQIVADSTCWILLQSINFNKFGWLQMNLADCSRTRW